MQVQPPCQTQGAAATTALLVVAMVKVVWAGGSGQALGESAGEAGGETPRSALAQRQKCCHSSRMSLERGAFEARLIIRSTQCSSERMYYFGSTEEKHPPTTAAEYQVTFTAAKQCS